MPPEKALEDMDPPVPLVTTVSAVITGASGAALLVLSEMIHYVIGVVLILLSLYLFNYARRARAVLAYPRGSGERETAAEAGADEPPDSAS